MASFICVGRTFLSTYEPRWTSTPLYTQELPTFYLPDVPGNDESSTLPWMRYNTQLLSTPIMIPGFSGLMAIPTEFPQLPDDFWFAFKPSLISYLTIHVTYPNPDPIDALINPLVTVDQHIAQGLPDLDPTIVPIEQWFRINGQPVVTAGDIITLVWSGNYAIPVPVPVGLDIPAITPLMPYPPYDPTWSSYYPVTATITGASHWKVNGKPMAQMGISMAPPLAVNFFSGQAFPFFSA